MKTTRISRSVKKVAVECKDGPWQGQTLYLQFDQTSAIFTIHGQTGRYAFGFWEPL